MIQAMTTSTVENFEDMDVWGKRELIGTAANSGAYSTCPEPLKICNRYASHRHPPRIAIDTTFGGYDDPYVVSDDDVDRKEIEEWHSRQNAMHLFLSKRSSSSLLTEGVVGGGDRWNVLTDGYGRKLLELLGTTSVGTLGQSFVSALASTLFLEFSRTFALFDTEAFTAIKSASLKYAVLTRYSALLTPLFEAKVFTASEPYDDGLGALVIDFIRLEERVTFALDDNEVELLFIEEGEFRSVYFENSSASLFEVVEFANNQFT